MRCKTSFSNKNKWEVDCSSSLNIGHVLLVGIPLFFKVSKVGRLSCISFHTKRLTLRGTFTFQIKFHTSGGFWHGLS